MLGDFDRNRFTILCSITLLRQLSLPPGLVDHSLDREGIGYCDLDGGTRRRGCVLERFKTAGDRVFLISLKAGGFGLNSPKPTTASCWSRGGTPPPRTRRSTAPTASVRPRPVVVYRTIARNTIEEKVVALARRKAALFNGVMDESDLFATSVTAADIRGPIE